MVQNIMALRFANVPFEQSINRHNVAAIFIDFKEPFGIEVIQPILKKFPKFHSKQFPG